jgi:hypothetical protein
MPAPNPSVELMRLINGYQVSQAIHVVATLGIADVLKDGPRTSDDLAAVADAHPRSLYRVLRALAAVGVFHESDDRFFSLTPLGDCLRSDAADPVGSWAAFIGRPYYWQAWGHLLHSVRTGEKAFPHVHGTDVWTYRAQHSRRGGDLRPSDDRNIGGGQGAVLAGILTAHPTVSGVLFDQPHVVARAEQVLRAAGVAERCEVVGAAFLRQCPKVAMPTYSRRFCTTGMTPGRSRS